MVLSSTLTQQMALLGVHLPPWPEEQETTANWIQLGKAYAEVVRFWRAHLSNASPSTKVVVVNFLSQLSGVDDVCPWDRWVASAVYHDVVDAFVLDRWEDSISDMQSLPLSPAQLFGASLALAAAHQLSGATHGIKRLLRDEVITGKTAVIICSDHVATANTSWRFSEAKYCFDACQKALGIHHEWLNLLQGAVEWSESESPEASEACRTIVLNSLERSLSLLGDEDKWAMLPLSHARQLLLGKQRDLAMELLQFSLPATLPTANRRASARLLASHLLAKEGEWQEASALHEAGVSEMQDYEMTNKFHQAQLEILLSETDLLSHELSIALQAGAFTRADPEAHSRDANTDNAGQQHWQTFSTSQLGQDLWVLEQLDWKKGGFFVEFGATDGVLLSNTWLLEKYFNWQGICAEPNPKFFKQLKRNRSCHLSSACVHRVSGDKMKFVLADAFGGLVDHARDDQHSAKRAAYEESGEVMEVETISLMSLLDQYNAPRIIDYLSVDTEGSEFQILEGIDWARYQFRCITVEHNYTAQRQQIRTLLLANGYQQHEAQWDDWYFKQITK